MKDLQVEELKKPLEPKAPALQHFENAENSGKARKEKKNNCRQQRGYWAPKDGRPQERSNPATEINNTFTAGGGTSRKNQNRGAKQNQA